MIPEIYRIKNKVWENPQTFTFTLEAKSNTPLVTPLPGQFNMIYAFGVGEVPISVSGTAKTSTELIHTIRNVGDVTRALSKLECGAVVGVRGPFGKPWPIQEAFGKELLIIAGGVALAPVRPVIEYALLNRNQFLRVIVLVGARKPDELLYQKEFAEWQLRGLEVHQTVDIANSGWSHHVGLIPSLLPQLKINSARTVAMVCGPEIMMKMTARGLVKLGLDGKKIFLSMERNMKCAIGLCGHCQYGEHFICKDGPVYDFNAIHDHLETREL